MQLHSAAYRGDHEAVNRQLGRGTPVDAMARDGKTPLMCAAEGPQANVSTLKLLIAAGAKVNAVSTELEYTPLSLAADSGDSAKVRCLLDAGADPRFVNSSGCTAITNVTEFTDAGHLEVLEMLLRAGANPDSVTKYGECPLRIAIRTGDFQAVRVLLQHNASREPAQFTDLMWAIAIGSVDDVSRQLSRGADLSARSYWEMTPWLLSLLVGDIRKFQLLLDAGAHVDDRGRCGKTNLMYPVSCNHVEMTRWLLGQGVDPNSTDQFGETPLMVAAQSGAADCTKLLLEGGAQIDAQSQHGSIAITEAANSQVVSVLVAGGADIDAIAGDGYHLLKSAAEGGDVEFVRALLAMGAPVDTTSTGDTALHAAAGADHIDVVRLLLESGADPNAEDVDGDTPLMCATSLECVETLLEAGASVHATDIVSADVLQHHSDPEILDRLREAGATVNPANAEHGTALHRAVKDGDVNLAEYLIEQGADVNAVATLNITPLMAAAERCGVELMRRLLAAGADIAATDLYGRTALFYAAAPESSIAFELMQETAEVNWYETDDELDPETACLLKEAGQQMEKLGIEPPKLDYGYQPSDDVTAIEVLVRAGADLEARDEEGLTPLLLTARCGRPSRLAALLRLGADVHSRDDAGGSAVDQTAQHHDAEQRAEILRMLEEAS